MSILMSILSNDGYIILNKYVMKALGLHEAILLGELCSEYIYWYKEEKLQDGFFYSTRENIEKETTLSPFQQRQALKKLTEMGLVEILEKDMPKKTYYKVNEEKVYKFLLETDLNFTDVKKFDDKTSNNLTSSDEKIIHQEVKKLEINNNNINNNYNLLETIIFSLGSSIGFMLVISIFATIRERFSEINVPKRFEGVPIAFITASIMALIFTRYVLK